MENSFFTILIFAMFGYLIGSFQSSYIFCKLFKKIDIREHGSGNAGATNTLRIVGGKIATLVFVCDLIKGALAYLITYQITQNINLAILAGFMAIIGHIYPFYLKFKGGKGVATTAGLLFVVNFPIALISTIIGVLIMFITKYVSLGSIIIVSLNALLFLLYYLFISPQIDYFILSMMFIIAFLIIFKHRTNIQRLLNGTENKSSLFTKKK